MCKHSICPVGQEGFISYRSVAISNLRSKYIEWAKPIYRQKGGIFVAEQKGQLREDCIDFAILVSDICDEIEGCSVYVNQLLRCSSSIGANLHEAKYAQSRADFISKLEISLKESYETEYWLELLWRKNRLSTEQYNQLRNKCGTIRRKLIASVTTAKANRGNRP
ncbi:MAG: four helix bundle protein [Ruminococcaceae bacterium]|nr:four helix bundle protein [Oscillospiraceae bacterium]